MAKFTKGSLFVSGSFDIEEDEPGSWYLECHTSLVSHDLSQNIGNLSLSMGNISYFFIKDCNPESFTEMLMSLGVTAVGELKIKAKNLDLEVMASAFASMSDTYPSLKSVELNYAGIYQLRNGSLDGLRLIERLEITQTSVGELPETLLSKMTDLKTLVIFNNPMMRTFPENLLKSNWKLQHLDLSMNYLMALPSMLLRSQDSLRYLDLGSNQFRSIPESLLEVSCQSLSEFLMLKDSCSSGTRRRKNLDLNSTPCSRFMPETLLRGCANLTTFKYSFSNRSKRDRVVFPGSFFNDASNLRTIMINRADLRTDLLSDLLRPLKSITYLDLSQNQLDTVQEGVVPSTVTTLRLANNPLVCQCDNLAELNILRLNNLVDYDHVQIRDCPSSEPDLLFGIEEATYSFCTFEESVWQTVGLLILGLICLLLVSLLTTICISERLRIWMYHNPVLSMCFRREKKKTLMNPDSGVVKDTDVNFDTFISYSEEDGEFAMSLADSLENPDNALNSEQLGGRIYRCCLHHRDWRAGESILENIIASVNDSHRTIILMSSHFLASHWCQAEFDEAYKRNKLIVIMLDDPDQPETLDLEAHAIVKSYMSTFTYLKRSDPNLWKKLAYHLPHKPMPKPKGKNKSQPDTWNKWFRKPEGRPEPPLPLTNGQHLCRDHVALEVRSRAAHSVVELQGSDHRSASGASVYVADSNGHSAAAATML